ncbi:MAG: hypothetical protein JRG71_15730 [Deltaproteobacteria bacterium]|nr:hypothetical protein [Deltaproteobacteria bacterium]
MTKITRFRHLVSIFSFILILLVGQTSGYSYVWCFGVDGHTVIEPAHDSACDEHKSEHDVLSSEFTVDHCGPCLDLLPSSSYASNRLRDVSMSLDTLVLAPSVDESFLRVASLPLQPQSVGADFVPRIRDQILHHRTIVLLN